MMAYETTNALASRQLRERVRKMQARARAAGFWYVLGTLVLTVLVFLPLIRLGNTPLGVTTFIEPFKTLTAAEKDWAAIAASALYAFILLTAVVNLLKCLRQCGRLSGRRQNETNAYNRNMRAMEKVGRIYSGTFGGALNFYFLIALLQTETVSVEPFGWAALGVGLFIHFLAGLLETRVSWFDVIGKTGKVIEEKRETGVALSFFRNLIQVVCVAAIWYFFVPVSRLGGFVANALNGSFAVDVIALLDLVTALCMLVLIKHATASTEYNYQVVNGKGMYNFVVFACFAFIASLGALVMRFLESGMPEKWNALFVPVIALVGFLADCIFNAKRLRLSRKAEEERYVEERNDLQTPPPSYWPYDPSYFAQLANGQPPFIPPQQGNDGQRQLYFVPVYYYPYVIPQQQPQPTEPAPVPETVEAPPVDKSLLPPEPVLEMDPNKAFKVRCPQCGKVLSVKDRSPYHRCSSCGKVFVLQKFRTYKKA